MTQSVQNSSVRPGRSSDLSDITDVKAKHTCRIVQNRLLILSALPQRAYLISKFSSSDVGVCLGLGSFGLFPTQPNTKA